MSTHVETPIEHGALQSTRIPYSGFERQYLSGNWKLGRAQRTLKDHDPYTGKTLVEIPTADERDLEEAYRSAEREQPNWASTLPAERSGLMLRAIAIMESRRKEIIEWLIRESGSARVKASLEFDFTLGIMREAASFPHRAAGRILPIDEPGKESRAYRQPVGVIGVISPWNWPLYLSMRSVAPALVLGNGVVLKPASDTPITGGTLLAKIYEEAGLPPGVFSVVVGGGSTIGDAFAKHPVPALISFTGSTQVGQHVADLAMTGPRLKRVALELGGNSPFVVLDDADLDQAVPSAVFSRFLHQGQICMSSNRLIVDAKVHDEFVDRFTAHVKTLKYGDPHDPDTVIGPIINQTQLSHMIDLMDKSVVAGARRLSGTPPQGLVLPPQVFVEVRNDMPIAKYETFGPIAPIIRVNGDEEALRVANDTSFGLSSAVFTRDEGRGLRFANRVQAGMTHINGTSVDDTPTGPFGGEKNSGIGRFGGDWILEEFTTVHWETVQHTPMKYPF